jgi:two-component system sensor kinase FixL
MGQMTSAFAHELNQPLAAISNYAKAASRTLARIENPEAAKARELLDKAAGQTIRAGQIISRLRDFVEKGDTNRAPENVTVLIEEALGLALVGTADTGVAVKVRIDPGLPPIMVDKIQIQQVILNLVRNSIEAMQSVSRRDLTVVAHEDASFVQVHVSDTGPGLAPEVAERLFQPFVTTKATGMGIGLSICRSIVDAHGGRLWATPNEGGGLSFRFRVPIGTASEETTHGK